jgi:hypothetical protein
MRMPALMSYDCALAAGCAHQEEASPAPTGKRPALSQLDPANRCWIAADTDAA